MITVLIVDDHPLTRQGIRSELSKTEDIHVLGEAQNGDEAILKARELKPDLVLLDISMPGRNGFEVLRQIHSEMPSIYVLMLSGYSEELYAVRCFSNGAHGYLTKGSASEELGKAIRKITQGRKYVSASAAGALAAEFGCDSNRSKHDRLSNREFQVLCLLGEGRTVSQIADLLCLSLSTVNTHRAHILDKMRLDSTAQIIRYVVEQNLIND